MYNLSSSDINIDICNHSSNTPIHQKSIQSDSFLFAYYRLNNLAQGYAVVMINPHGSTGWGQVSNRKLVLLTQKIQPKYKISKDLLTEMSVLHRYDIICYHR